MFTERDLARMSDPTNAMATGVVGEHLVCADIIASGYLAHITTQGSIYDIIAEVGGELLRVQAKTTVFERDLTSAARTSAMGYSWYVRRRGKAGSKRLTDEEADVIALVALDGPWIAYLEPRYCGQTVQMMSPRRPMRESRQGTQLRRVDAFPFSRFVEDRYASA